MKRIFPWTTLALVGACITIYGSTAVSDLLVYQRHATLEGEIWRLLSGHLVHFSKGHLAANLFVLAVVGALVEMSDTRRFWRLCAVSALLIGVSLLSFEPHLLRYGGMSGIATACVVDLCLTRGAGARDTRFLWHGILGLVVAKLVFETVTNRAVFAQPAGISSVVVPLAHWAGVVSAVTLWAAEATKRRLVVRQRSPTSRNAPRSREFRPGVVHPTEP